MELRQLQYFVAVVRHGQFTRAAEELWITQPALSQQVRRRHRGGRRGRTRR
jgi:DNA-binding transcriptional LysR family regulator